MYLVVTCVGYMQIYILYEGYEYQWIWVSARLKNLIFTDTKELEKNSN